MKNYQKIEDSSFVEFIYNLIDRKDDYFNRSILVTPYFGGYSQISGFVITVEGSPPKGTIILLLSSSKFITTTSPIKEHTYGDSYIKLTAFLKNHSIDKLYKIQHL